MVLSRSFVRAIVEAFISGIAPQSEKSVVEQSTDFIIKVNASMQPLYRYGLVLIGIGFCGHAFFLTGRNFKKLSTEQRLGLMRKWLASPIGIMRNFINFFLNMTILFYYDSDEALDELGVDIKSHRSIQCFYAGAE